MPLSYSLYLVLASYGLGALFSLLFGRWKVVARSASLIWGLLGSGLSIYLAWQIFDVGTSLDFQLFASLRTITTAVHIDIFTAFFLFLIGVVGIGFFGFWSDVYNDDHWSIQALAHGLFLLMILVVASSNVLFFLFVMELFAMGGLLYILITKVGPIGVQKKALQKYVISFAGASAALSVMWLILASSAQNLYFGALVQGVSMLADNLAWLVIGTLLLGILLLGLSTKHVLSVASSYVSGMYSALMLIMIGYLFLRVELFFVPAVSLWINVAITGLGFAILLASSVYAWLRTTVVTFWSLALAFYLVIGGMLLWSIQGNVAAIVSIWSVALFWGLLVLVINTALSFWVEPYPVMNTLRYLIWGSGLFTTLWLFFQGLWQSLILVNDGMWRMVMLIVLVLTVVIGVLYSVVSWYRSANLGSSMLSWRQVGHWILIVWMGGVLAAMFGAGVILQWLGQYTANFLGLSGTLVLGNWTSYSVSMQGMAHTIHLPFFLLLVVLFLLVISLLASGEKHSSDPNV